MGNISVKTIEFEYFCGLSTNQTHFNLNSITKRSTHCFSVPKKVQIQLILFFFIHLFSLKSNLKSQGYEKQFCLSFQESTENDTLVNETVNSNVEFTANGDLALSINQNLPNKKEQHQFILLNPSNGEVLLRRNNLIPENASFKGIKCDLKGVFWVGYSIFNKVDTTYESHIIGYTKQLKIYRDFVFKCALLHEFDFSPDNSLLVAYSMSKPAQLFERLFVPHFPRGTIISKINTLEYRLLRVFELRLQHSYYDSGKFLFNSDNSFFYLKQYKVEKGGHYEFHLYGFDNTGQMKSHETLIDYAVQPNLKNAPYFKVKNVKVNNDKSLELTVTVRRKDKDFMEGKVWDRREMAARMENASQEVNPEEEIDYSISFSSTLQRKEIKLLEGLEATIDLQSISANDEWQKIPNPWKAKVSGNLNFKISPSNPAEPNGPCIWIRKE